MTEREMPVKLVGEHMVWFYYLLGLASAPSRSGQYEGVRSAHNRVKIAQHNHSPDKVSREYLNKLDDFDSQFQSLSRDKIYVPGLTLPQPLTYSQVNLGNVDKSMVIIPAFAGDHYGIEPLARESALKGYEVTTILFPESFLGESTEEFAVAMESSFRPQALTYSPHTDYFFAAIDQLRQENIIAPTFDLLGYSTGGAIMAELLSNPAFSHLVTNAIILSPGSVCDQNKWSLISGFITEAPGLVPWPNNTKCVNCALTFGKNGEVDNANLSRRKRITKVLLEKVCRRSPYWTTARVREGGKLIIQIGKRDWATKAWELAELTNPSMKILSYPWTHLGVLYNAEKLMTDISKYLEK